MNLLALINEKSTADLDIKAKAMSLINRVRPCRTHSSVSIEIPQITENIFKYYDATESSKIVLLRGLSNNLLLFFLFADSGRIQ